MFLFIHEDGSAERCATFSVEYRSQADAGALDAYILHEENPMRYAGGNLWEAIDLGEECEH